MRRIIYWLSLALIFTIPFKEIFVLPGIGSVSRVLGLLITGLWLLTVIHRGEIRKPGIFHLAAFAFFIWNLASILWSINPNTSIERASTYLRMVVFVWLIWDLFDSKTAIWRGCQAYVLGTWVTTGSLFFNYANNIEAYSSANGRFAATGFNTNETGLLLALALPMAWYLAVAKPLSTTRVTGGVGGEGKDANNPPPLLRTYPSFRISAGLLNWLNFLQVPLAIFSILLTASRGSLIAATPVLLVMLFTLGKTSWLQRVVLVAGVIAVGTTFATLIPEENLERLSTTSEELSASDLNGRVSVWRDGWEVFEENPVIGVGTGTFRSAIETGKAPHNVFVALAVDLGIVGLLLFVVILLVVMAAIWHQRGIERIVWLAFILTWLLGSTVGNWEYENVTWLFFCFIVKGAALAVNQRGNQYAHLAPNVKPANTLLDQAMPLKLAPSIKSSLNAGRSTEATTVGH